LGAQRQQRCGQFMSQGRGWLALAPLIGVRERNEARELPVYRLVSQGRYWRRLMDELAP
jgi:hypothetical protein